MRTMRDDTAQHCRDDIPSLRVSSICPWSCNPVITAWSLENSSSPVVRKQVGSCVPVSKSHIAPSSRWKTLTV